MVKFERFQGTPYALSGISADMHAGTRCELRPGMSVRRLVLAASALSLIVSGCGKTITLRGPITPSMAREVTRTASHKQVEITLAADPAPQGQNGLPSPDKRVGHELVTSKGTFAFREDANRQPNPLTTVPFQQVRSITITDRKKGAAMGALVGALAGFLLGVAFSTPISFGCKTVNNGPPVCESKDPSLTVAIGVALGTVALGAAMGAAKGDRTTYVFQDR